jgi:hypothetical protein
LDEGIVHWKISKSSMSSERLLEQFVEVRQRQFRAYNIPSGMEMADMEGFWEQLDFRGGSTKVPFVSKMFQFPSSNIKRLRQVAREGLEELERRREEFEGKVPVFLRSRGKDEESVSSEMENDDASSQREPLNLCSIYSLKLFFDRSINNKCEVFIKLEGTSSSIRKTQNSSSLQSTDS